MNKSLYTVKTFTQLNTRRFFRDRLAIFFTILFPLIFLFVFGGIFGGNNNVSFRIAFLNQSKSAFARDMQAQAEKQKIFKIDKKVTDLAGAREKMNQSQLDAAIVLPPDFGEIKAGAAFPTGTVDVYYTQNNEQAGQTLISLLQAQLGAVNKRFVAVANPFTVEAKRTSDKGLSQFDYTFSGLLGFAIIGIGIFGPVNVFPELKKQGILRRLHTTPLKVWQYFVSTALTQVLLGSISLGIMTAVAITVFDLKMVGNWFELAAFLALSIITILGIGLALGGWAKNERQVAPLANIVVFPMMFLSGTFFPRFLMPDILQKISGFLPLSPAIDGIRLIATEGKSLIDVAPQIGLLGLWLIVIYTIAFRVFRWE